MKLKLAVLMLGIVTVCASAADKKKTAQKAAAAPLIVTIPKGAVANPDGQSYSYKDKQGKRWTYTKTPFGIMKAPAADPATATAAPGTDLSGVKAIDKGDTVHFERPGPFGVMKWDKNKTDLNDDERRLVESQNPDSQNAKPESHD
ncbi:MAG TPA: hypothetical protein VG297_20035 [Bryobacteraceae bacterium]|jgi:hypothetical protein|nr:hypothetical protein [Bryobacteraceae bacterium]